MAKRQVYSFVEKKYSANSIASAVLSVLSILVLLILLFISFVLKWELPVFLWLLEDSGTGLPGLRTTVNHIFAVSWEPYSALWQLQDGFSLYVLVW